MIKWNEYTWYSRLAAIVFFILILPSLTFYIGVQYQLTKSSIESEISSVNTPTPIINTPLPNTSATLSASSNVACVKSSQFFVAYRDSTIDLGTDYLIKHVTGQENNPPCVFNAKYFEYATTSWYFKGVMSNMLIMDVGTTAGIRGLLIYNLDTQKEVFSDEYEDLHLSFEKNTISYLSPIDEKADVKNCTEFNENTSNGFKSFILTHIVLSLNDFSRKDLGEHICSASE